MLNLIATQSLADRTILTYRRTWKRFERFAQRAQHTPEEPSTELVLAFLAALRTGDAPGSVTTSSAETLRLTSYAVRYVCVINGWPDPTRSPVIDGFLAGAAREDAPRSRRSTKPLTPDTVRRVMQARPTPGVIALRGRVAVAALRHSSVTVGQLVRLPIGEIRLGGDQAVLGSRMSEGPIVLDRHSDPDVCPVRALELLLRHAPLAEFPLSVSLQADGRLRFAETPSYEGTKHVAAPLANQVAHAVTYAGGSRQGGVRALSEAQYELAAWRVDHGLSTALRDESSLLLAWHAGMRRGELAALVLGRDLRMHDEAVEIRRHSRSGTTWLQTLYPSEDRRLCAVAALRRWTRLARLADGDFVFCRVGGRGLPRPQVAMGFETWTLAWRRLADRCEVDPATLTALSPRRGFVSLANQSGASLPQIVSTVGPHSAGAVARQIRRDVKSGSVAGRVGL